MYVGPQIVTMKLVQRSKRKEIIDAQVDDKPAQDILNTSVIGPRSKAIAAVETPSEKLERKVLAQKRRHERLVEQEKIALHMEDLMEKVIHETPLSRKEEDNLRAKIKTIMTKVKKESDKIDIVSRHPSLIELRSTSSSQRKSDFVSQSSQSNLHLKSDNQGAFLLWNDKNPH